MDLTIYPSTLNGSINAPTSKSCMQRACALAFIKVGKTTIHNIGKSDDDLAAMEIIQQLGATITKLSANSILIESKGILNEPAVLDCGESGLSVRMFTNIAALINENVTIFGKGSLLKRPLHFFEDILPKLGKTVESNNGFLPIEISGQFTPNDITIDGSLSSQYLTGLLIAFAAAQIKDKTIYVTALKSKPYIDLTLSMLTHFGYDFINQDYKQFIFKGLNDNFYKEVAYQIEGDWSGAAFLKIASAINNPITIIGLNNQSTQADRKIEEVLDLCGYKSNSNKNDIHSPNNLIAFDFDATECPDLFPPIAVLAAFCKGKSNIKGMHRLTHKESNRAITIQEEFQKLGIKVDLDTENDTMVITGGVQETEFTKVSSRHDHRIAMACAIIALNANKPITIENAEAVNKSYPNFFEDLKILEAKIIVNC